MPENLVAWLPDPDGAKSYPITSYTWMIFRKDNGNPAKAKAMREMVEYSLTEARKSPTRWATSRCRRRLSIRFAKRPPTSSNTLRRSRRGCAMPGVFPLSRN
jgi:hypothetical protein